jgi:hypothetical protein
MMNARTVDDQVLSLNLIVITLCLPDEQTFYLFTRCAMIFLVYGIIGLLQMVGIMPANFLPYNDTIYSCIGVTLFSLFLAHHTKLITAGKHAKYQMSEKNYVLGAIQRHYQHFHLHSSHHRRRPREIITYDDYLFEAVALLRLIVYPEKNDI